MPTDINDYFKKKSNGSKKPDNEKKEPPKRPIGGGNDNKMPDFKMPDFMNKLGKKVGFVYAGAAVIVLLVLFKPFVVINSGEIGIIKTTGKYNPTPLNAGIHFYLPGVQKVLVVDTKVRIINYRTIGKVGVSDSSEGIRVNSAINVLDQRGLPVSIEMTVQYRLNSENAPQTIATWGVSWEDKIINPVVRDVTRNVVGRYSAEELPINRNVIATLIEEEIRKTVDELINKPAHLESIQLRQIVLPDKIQDQIQRVQIAKQEAQRVKYEVERAKQEAEKKAALATGNAEAHKIEAQGKAIAITIEANAQSKANNLISRSLTSKLLNLRQIETQGKFNDALKENKDAKIFLTPGGAVPNIWLDSGNPRRSTRVSQ
jgi:regulator of protease activity HflC (stomatin/prohibitin superfamily)